MLFFNVPFFPDISVIHISCPFHFRNIPSFIFHHFRVIVHLRNVPSCFYLASQSIIAGCPKLSVLYVPLLPEISVMHISSFPFQFRIIPSSYFRNFPSFIFHHFRFISGLFRCLVSGSFRPPYFIISVSFPDYSALAVRVIFDLGLFCLETETQQYVLLGIIPSFIFHHFRFISGLFRRSYSIISVSFPDYSVVLRPRLF